MEEGYAVQTNVVRQNGKRGALCSPSSRTARPARSTSSSGIRKSALPHRQGRPAAQSLKITPLFDQSVFVR